MNQDDILATVDYRLRPTVYSQLMKESYLMKVTFEVKSIEDILLAFRIIGADDKHEAIAAVIQWFQGVTIASSIMTYNTDEVRAVFQKR